MEEKVKEIASYVNSGALQRKEYCVLVTLDVRNLFNTARWTVILAETGRRRIQKYLVEAVKSYLQDRKILVDHGA